jgi:hypothetical protein
MGDARALSLCALMDNARSLSPADAWHRGPASVAYAVRIASCVFPASR